MFVTLLNISIFASLIVHIKKHSKMALGIAIGLLTLSSLLSIAVSVAHDDQVTKLENILIDFEDCIVHSENVDDIALCHALMSSDTTLYAREYK